jgi:hypothetical protein
MSKLPTFVQQLNWRKVALLFYPYLLAYYPIFALRNYNIIYVDFATILRSLILVTAGTALVWALTYPLIRNLEKSSVIVSLIVAFFLSYGHLYILLSDKIGELMHHRYLVVAYFSILLFLMVLTLKKDQVARVLSQFLAAASLVLLGLTLFQSAWYDIAMSRSTAAVQREMPIAQNQPDQQLPDIYLIILDGHTRSDVLKSRFEYDNTFFIEQLEGMGFYVASCSQSNYASTKLSLTSAMFASYIHDIVPDGTILPSLDASLVHQTLKSRGYQTIAFANRSSGHFDLNEDVLISRNQTAFRKFDLFGGISEFEKMMVDTSFLRFVEDAEIFSGFNQTTLQRWELWDHYYQTQYNLSELEKVPDLPGPKFVFAHVMVPHSPFVFSSDGSFLYDVNPISGYRSNTEYIDNQLPSVLSTIITKSNIPPIIIVIGDHGPSTRKTITKQMRMSILSAYFVNDATKASLYPTVTPINAFRVILNGYFGGSYPLLEDRSYYAYKQSQVEGADTIDNTCLSTH